MVTLFRITKQNLLKLIFRASTEIFVYRSIANVQFTIFEYNQYANN